MSKKSTASVIVITFNRLSLLQACLASLRQQTVKGFETVVVNNGCTDGTPKWLSSRQGLSVVNLPLNAGVAAARNAGVQAARGAVLVFVDDDCTMPMDWLETLLAGYASEEVSGVGGTVLTIPGQPSWFEGGGVNRFGSVALVHAGTPCFFPYLPGCNMSFRRAALEAVGGFDPSFFYGYDESDACIRLLQAGHRLVFESRACVYHLPPLEGKYLPSKFYWSARSRRYFMLKNFSERLSWPEIGCFEAGNALWNLYRFLAGCLGVRGRVPFLELLPSLKGAIAGYLAGLNRVSTHPRFF